jgi:3-hydroxy acid dehydrogenase / malonic semialdehyde reductase
MVGTNVLGLVNVTHAVLNRFLIPAGKGTILNISSITGLEVPQKGMGEVIYHACKSFLEGFMNALRNETVGTDIRVLALRPGFVKTHFHYQRVGRDDRAFEGIFEGTEPLEAEDIAAAAVWMLQLPERISIKAMDVLPSAQRSLSVVDKEWNARRVPNK